MEEYQHLEETRKLVKAEALQKTSSTSSAAGEEGPSTDEKNDEQGEAESTEATEQVAGDDEDKYAEEASMPGVKVDIDSRTRITVRNLRIREDTAKYLDRKSVV